MTPQEIDALPAGRELDALVADRVMGWLHVGRGLEGFAPGDRPLPSDWGRPSAHESFGPVAQYSTDLAAAWSILERFPRPLWQFTVTQTMQYERNGWGAGLTKDARERSTFMGYADTAPLAICRAALKAVNGP